MQKNRTLIFCGLSHLSINYGVSAAKLNQKIIFFDTKKKINDFHNNKIKFEEPNLYSYLKKYKKNIIFTSMLPKNISNSIYFLAIDIVTSSKNISNYKSINEMINFLCLNIKIKKNPLVLMSQVKPKFTRKINWPKKLLFYQVETLIFGDAINRAENPERIIVGTHNGLKVNDRSYAIYLNLFKVPIINMNYEEAELCKMFINSYLVSNVILTNNLASICKKLNLNWEKPKQALMLDKRIGKFAYLKPGLGISGGNLERDIVNLNKLNKELKINTSLFSIFLNESQRQKKWLSNIINKSINDKIIKKTSKIGIIGISYKEKTNSIKNSPSLIILKKLGKYKIYCYDSLNNNTKIKNFNIKWSSISNILETCDILFIMHRNKSVNKQIMANKDIAKNLKLIIDPFSIVSKGVKRKISNHVSI